MKYYWVLLLLMVVVSMPVTAGINNVLYKKTFGECELTISHDVAEGFDGVIMLRSLTKNFKFCAVLKQQVHSSLDYAMEALATNSDFKEVSSVFLGRLRSYKWMGEYLTRQSKNNSQWDPNIGKPLVGTSNTYVNAILNVDEILSPFSAPLEKYGYKVMGVECEKIMLNKEKLPYEALCWLIITPSE